METAKKETRGRKKGYKKPNAFNTILPIRMTKKERDKAILASNYLELNLSEEVRNFLTQIVERANKKAESE